MFEGGACKIASGHAPSEAPPLVQNQNLPTPGLQRLRGQKAGHPASDDQDFNLTYLDA